MTKERNIVAIIRRLSKDLYECPLDKIDVCMGNLETAFEAAKLRGLEDLAHATLAYDILSTANGRQVVFEALNDPLQFQRKAEINIEKYKEYLA